MAAKLPITDGLTSGGSTDYAHRRTYCGQAHFAVGPEHCRTCDFWGYSEIIRNAAGNAVGTRARSSCLRFYELTGAHGPAVPGHALACRHYVKREER